MRGPASEGLQYSQGRGTVNTIQRTFPAFSSYFTALPRNPGGQGAETPLFRRFSRCRPGPARGREISFYI